MCLFTNFLSFPSAAPLLAMTDHEFSLVLLAGNFQNLESIY